MDTVEQFNENFNAKKPKKKGLLIGGIVLALVIVAFALVYFFVLTSPKFIFSKTIDKLLVVDAQSYDSIKMTTEIKASVDLEDTTYQEELEEIEKLTLKTGAQMDVKEKQEIVDLGLEYDNQAVIDARVYYNDGEMYAYLEDLFDKYIEIDMDEETKAALDEIFETATSEKNLKNTEKAVKIIRDELKTQIKENGEFEKKKDEIQIGKDDVKVTKSTVTISAKKMDKIAGNIFSNLAKNDEFLDCFEESPKDFLKEIAEEFKDSDSSSEDYLKISLYTKGLLNNKLVATGIEIYNEDTDTAVVVSVTKEDEGIYLYNNFIKENKQKTELISGKVEIQKDKDTKKEQSGTLIITTEVTEIGSVKLEIDYSLEYDQGIDKINTSKSVNINDLTETDIQSIGEKLMERPLIGDIISNLMDTDLEDEFIVDPDTGISVESTLTTAQNEVKDEDYGYSVTYSIPTGFEYNTDITHDYRKYYDFENADYTYIDAIVSLDWYTEDEYIEEEINWDYEYYLESTEYYENVELGEIKTLVVGDKTFKYVSLSYDASYGTKYQDVYVWYPLGDEHIFTIKLEAADTEVTEDIIKGFLNINVTEIN